MTSFFALVACAVLAAFAPSAPEPVNMGTVFQTSIVAGTAFSVLGTHDGTNTTSYRLRLDAATSQTLPVSSLQAGTIAFNVTAGLPAGSHVAAIDAIGPGGTTASADVPFTVDPAQSGVPAPRAAGKPAFTLAGTTPPPPTLTVTQLTPWVQAATGNVTTPAVALAAGDALVAAVVVDTGTTAPVTTLTSTPGLTWTKLAGRGGASTSTVEIWAAQVGSPQSALTVTLAATQTHMRALQLYRVTGQSTTQLGGATWSGTATTKTWSAVTYTSSIANSTGIFVAADYWAGGSPTSTDVISAGHFTSTGSSLSWGAVSKAALTATTGTAVSFNITTPATTASWNGVAAELRPR